MELVNNPLWAKLLDLSIALFVLFALAAVEGWFIWKLWNANQALSTARATELAVVNDQRLKDAQDYATNRHAAMQQSQSVIEQINRVLAKMDASGTADDRTRKMLLAICEKLELPLKDFI